MATRRIGLTFLLVLTIVLSAGCGRADETAALRVQLERLQTDLTVTQAELKRLEAELDQLPSGGWLNDSFTAAAIQYQVPVELLKAIAYSETRWAHRSGSLPSIDGRYGLMGLQRGSTLPQAAQLLGLSEETLRTNPMENIYGGAAVLRSLYGPGRPSPAAGDWYNAVAQYAQVKDESLRKQYADEVFNLLKRGAERAVAGEELTIEPGEVIVLPKPPQAPTTSRCMTVTPQVRSGFTTIYVYFSCKDDPMLSEPVAVPRQVPAGAATLRTAVEELLQGPTAEERAAGFGSWFSAQTAGLLRSAVVLEGGRAVVDFRDFSLLIPNASTSNGSRELRLELGRTVAQFPDVTEVEYRFDGSCQKFGDWLQTGCTIVSADWYRQ